MEDCDPVTKPPTWFSRWRSYPLSVLGHIGQGVAGGLLFASNVEGTNEMAFVWALGYFTYQGLSFARKVNTTGRGDTAGLDAYDFVVGMVPAFIIAKVLGM